MLQVLVLSGFLLGLVLARQLSTGESWEDGSIAGSSCLSDLTESDVNGGTVWDFAKSGQIGSLTKSLARATSAKFTHEQASGREEYEERVYTPLMIAASYGHTEALSLLVAAGADINGKDSQRGETALMMASWDGQLPCVQVLLAAGAAVDVPSKDGSTALMYAAFGEDPRIIKALLQAGADIHHRNHDNTTGLIWAAIAGNADVLNAFIEAGADIDAQEKSGRTVLTWACNAGCVPAVEALIKAGAKISGEREDGTPALMSVAFKGLPTLVQLLVDAGANIVMQEDGWTALEWATRANPTATALALMEAREEVGHITMRGDNSGVMIAGGHLSAEYFHEMLRAKADRNAHNKASAEAAADGKQ